MQEQVEILTLPVRLYCPVKHMGHEQIQEQDTKKPERIRTIPITTNGYDGDSD